MCDCMEAWAAWLRAQGHAKNTLRVRLGAVRRASDQAGVDACQITTIEMIGYLDQQLAPWTRSCYVTSLRAWGRWLVKTGRRVDDPGVDLPKPRSPRGVPRPVGENDLERLLGTAQGRERAMIVLAAYAGLRVHEIAKIRGEDVDADRLFIEGKGGVRAMVPTHPLLWSIAKAMPRDGWWFTSRSGAVEHLCPHTVSRMMIKVMRAAGVRGTPHHLRHRYGTAVLRSSGGNLRVAQELLRHASPATTAWYTLVEDSAKRDAVYALA